MSQHAEESDRNVGHEGVEQGTRIQKPENRKLKLWTRKP
jgi:hypothetical protein